MGNSDIRDKLWNDAKKVDFIIVDINHRSLEDRLSLILQEHLRNNRIDLSLIPLYNVDLTQSGKTLNFVIRKVDKLTCQYYIEGYKEDLWEPPVQGGEYHGNELGDFNALRPDFLYRDSEFITLIEGKLGADQTYPFKQNMAICAQYARYADWLISAKINKNIKIKNFIILTSRGFITKTTNKIPKEFREALDYNSRKSFVDGYFLIWEDIFAAYRHDN